MNPSLSFLDDVPFVINPIFLQTISKSNRELNANYNFNRAKSILNTQLDFSLEAKVLTSEFRSKFTSNHRKKSFSFHKSNTNLVENNLDDSDKSILSSSLPSTVLKYSNVPLEPIKHIDILKSCSDKNIEKINDNNNNNNNNNNFKDLFDTNTLDPFDDLELKTLNDIEELKKILNQNENKKKQHIETANIFSNDNDKKLNSKYLNQMPVNTNHSALCAVDSFGLPKLTFFDLNDSEK